METLKKFIICIALIAISATTARAQYYQLVNQLTDMMSTAISGGANYRGFVEATYLNGFGNKSASFAEISTTQGIKCSNVFYMGVGAGVDYMFTKVNDGYYQPQNGNGTTSGVMIPLFSDFRFNFGSPEASGFFIDLKIGAGFYVSDKYILVGDGYINSSESFLLRPSIGMRVPVSKSNSKYAVNFSANYQLLTNTYWYNPDCNNSITLNSFGISVSFEW